VDFIAIKEALKIDELKIYFILNLFNSDRKITMLLLGIQIWWIL